MIVQRKATAQPRKLLFLHIVRLEITAQILELKLIRMYALLQPITQTLG